MINQNIIHRNNNNIKKIEPFIAPGSQEKVTKQEIEKRKKKAELIKEIGESIYSLDSESEHENPYRAEALILITQGKEVPTSLKEKIKKYDQMYCKQQLAKNKTK